MKLKYIFTVFTVTLFFLINGGFIYAQESGDTADSQEDGGVAVIPGDDELASLLTETQNPRAVVAPLLKTKWGQGAPYKNMLPQGYRSFCGMVGAAQIMKYHNYPPHGFGQSEVYTMKNGAQVPPVNFNNTYDWNNMLYSYRGDGKDSNERQRSAVATLIYHIGVARGRDFTTGNNKNNWPFVFSNYFGYDRSIQRLERKYYSDADWENILKSQLDAGLPVLYAGYEPGGDHTFVIDGYDNTGRYHINMGWSGRSDGWYFLNNINPSGGNRRYYNNHNVIINIKPEANGVSAGFEMALRAFTAGKTSVTQNELFTVTVRIINTGSLDSFPGGNLGIALVDDNNGRIIQIIGNRNRAALNPGSSSSSAEINCFIPETVKPGLYRMMAVIMPEDGSWRTITKSPVSEGVPASINVVLAPGDAKGGGYGMAVQDFTVSSNSVVQAEKFSVFIRTRNVGANTYPGGNLGVALVDNNGGMEIIRTVNWSGTNINNTRSSTINNCAVPKTVKPGKYQLRIVVRPHDSEQWKISTFSYNNAPTAIDFTVR